MERPLSRSGTKVESSLPWTRELQLEAMSVCSSMRGGSLAPLIQINIASGTVKKVIEINPYLLGTMAGGAGT